MELIANEVQQAADMGDPEPEVILPVAQEYVRSNPLDRDAEDLKILGAMARLTSVSGEPGKALPMAREATEGWLAIRRAKDASYALCSWFRLAGVLGHRGSLAEAERTAAQAQAAAPFSPVSQQYIALARSVAHALCGDKDPEHVETLVRLAGLKDRDGNSYPSLPDHVRWSAARQLLRFFPQDPRSGQVEVALREGAAGDPQQAEEARTYVLLVAMDRAVASGDLASARAHLESLRTVRGTPDGLVSLLIRTAQREGAEPAEYVARHYPY